MVNLWLIVVKNLANIVRICVFFLMGPQVTMAFNTKMV